MGSGSEKGPESLSPELIRVLGEVKPGFTKAEILRPAREDPRAPGGVFERVGGLLSELLEQV